MSDLESTISQDAHMTLREVTAENVNAIGHGGGTLGYRSVMLGDLDEGTGVIVLANGPANPYDIAAFALQLIRAAWHSVALPPLPPQTDPTLVDNAGGYMSLYCAGNKMFHLVAEGGRLL